MTSHKQIVANQRNALKSTGPRTEEGKAIVCQNAIKHGVLCQEIPIDENESAIFEEFRLRMTLQLNPEGDFEHFIALVLHGDCVGLFTSKQLFIELGSIQHLTS